MLCLAGKSVNKHTMTDSKRKNSDTTTQLLEDGVELPSRRKIHRSFSRSAESIEEDYTDEGKIGTGSFATVFKMRHRSSQKLYAVKKIEAEMFEKHKVASEQEIDVLSKLDHPNIVKLHEVVRTPSHLCIVMELCLGGDLFDRIVAREKYCENDAKFLTRSLLEGVKYLHDNRIVHW
eukprot:c5163_g1_i3.p1 GENE.c5163_g1_i3~~c5163_g1_i3.p1  ORF type:complete len:177 (-),score=31.24 c5163_g1_i3:815-1345(-)